jgi:hypothetical protein
VPTAAEIAAQMVAALAVSDPEVDTAIGTTVRKILDAVAEPISEAYVDRYLIEHLFDIGAKQGADLDDFVATYSMGRFPARRATGVAVLSRPTAADQDYPVPAGTQLSTATAPQVVFATTAPAVLPRGGTSIEVPIVAVVGGTSGNLVAASLTALGTPVSGVGSVGNPAPTTGGTDPESDAALIERFKRTVFRNLAGTADMFLALALEGSTADGQQDSAASRANVVGASQRWREQVQVVSGAATSSIPTTAYSYVFPNSSLLGPDIDGDEFLVPGVHYSFDDTADPPTITSLAGGLVDGQVYDLDYEYSSSASRNDPVNGITNRVDVWVDGQRPVEATVTAYMRTAVVFDNTTGSALQASRYVRLGTAGTHPTVGNRFVRLALGPVLAVPDTLTIGGTTYAEGTDYWVVHDDTASGYSPTSYFGLEWLASHSPADGAAVPVVYSYNALPRDVEDRVGRWRLVGTDARVHQAKQVLLRLSMAVMLTPGSDLASVQDAVEAALTAHMASRGFDAAVQVSDLIQVAHGVEGVDNVRFLNSSEPLAGAQYAIERVSTTGARISYVTTGSPARATDVQFGDNEVPVLYAVNLSLRAANSFRGGS